ncbi:hypothetical protein CEXT_722901 [Caerostris extrusa]|uniref:Reverse transcriptase n=1 Tax=Caerostris extrusa TaxID=172846 RepID=A0AAV4RAA5_CAEEX|nr:hypothetical protein CEXT_722901 [Caerostris extrusa]
MSHRIPQGMLTSLLSEAYLSFVLKENIIQCEKCTFLRGTMPAELREEIQGISRKLFIFFQETGFVNALMYVSYEEVGWRILDETTVVSHFFSKVVKRFMYFSTSRYKL